MNVFFLQQNSSSHFACALFFFFAATRFHWHSSKAFVSFDIKSWINFSFLHFLWLNLFFPTYFYSLVCFPFLCVWVFFYHSCICWELNSELKLIFSKEYYIEAFENFCLPNCLANSSAKNQQQRKNHFKLAHFFIVVVVVVLSLVWTFFACVSFVFHLLFDMFCYMFVKRWNSVILMKIVIWSKKLKKFFSFFFCFLTSSEK